MDRFEKIVIGIALVLLIATLTIMGISMAKHQGTGREPAACPDFWYSSYFQPCSSSPHGCCPDGATASNADGSNCNSTPCSLTPNKCCPDGVTAMTDDPSKCPAAVSKCFNVHKLGENGLMSMDFTTDEYVGTQGMCNKQLWAKKNGLNWDGVSNMPNAC